jgi:kynurenine formamidase
MKTKSLVVGYVFALALFLFAQRHPNAAQAGGFRTVVDLTYPMDSSAGARTTTLSNHKNSARLPFPAFETRIEAPARVGAGLWTVDQIPPQRLIAPLVVFDLRDRVVKDPDYQLSVMDVAEWERRHGDIPLGSIVMALTGFSQTRKSGSSRVPGYSAEAARFLVEGRSVVGLGTDGQNMDGQGLDAMLSHSAYSLENVANLDRVPANGSMVVIAPVKLGNRIDAPVRILALAR